MIISIIAIGLMGFLVIFVSRIPHVVLSMLAVTGLAACVTMVTYRLNSELAAAHWLFGYWSNSIGVICMIISWLVVAYYVKVAMRNPVELDASRVVNRLQTTNTRRANLRKQVRYAVEVESV